MSFIVNLERATSWCLCSSSLRWSMITLLRSSPPRFVSPPMPSTSKRPSWMLMSDTSSVPPPKSNTTTIFVPATKRPYAMAAAVGSFIRRMTLKPAMDALVIVALRCESLKYAGTVITTLSMRFPSKYASADAFRSDRMHAETSSGCSSAGFSLRTTWTAALPCFVDAT
uniref:Uncharacterized protein n=1 Tax=Globisporangium ultimum (strain ATCC 200006 / CBS 805.95 / DAOM BR144) TaxID=431595 RepID=K3WD56_GLOUD